MLAPGMHSGFVDAVEWRRAVAECIAAEMDTEKFGVRAVYLFGSTEAGNAGRGSDIDLLVHTDNTSAQQQLLREWLAGWDKALCLQNHYLTGHKPPYMLDVHYVTERDINDNECFASKIRSLDEPAAPLRIRA